MEDALLQRSLLRLALSVLVTATMSAESVAFLMTLGLPRSVSSGTIFVASAGFNVHGLIYIYSANVHSLVARCWLVVVWRRTTPAHGGVVDVPTPIYVSLLKELGDRVI